MTEQQSVTRIEDTPKWYRELDLKKLEHLSGLGYTPSQLARYFRAPLSEFMFYFQQPDSALAEAYHRGRLEQDIRESESLAAHATSSDTKSATFAQQWERRRKSRSLRAAIEDICFTV